MRKLELFNQIQMTKTLRLINDNPAYLIKKYFKLNQRNFFEIASKKSFEIGMNEPYNILATVNEVLTL
jgi:hypothetical protein